MKISNITQNIVTFLPYVLQYEQMMLMANKTRSEIVQYFTKHLTTLKIVVV